MGRPTARLGGRCSLVATAVVAAMAAVLAVCLVPAAVDGRRTITATGRFVCAMPDGRTEPIVGSSIRLMNQNFAAVSDRRMASGSTAADGTFRLRGRGGDPGIGRRTRPDPYVRLTYRSVGAAHNIDVGISVRFLRTLGNYRGDKTPTKRNTKRSADFGTVVINSLECQAYVDFRAAMIDFKARTGSNTPGGRLPVRTRAIIHGGAAYALYDEIKLPRKTRVTPRLATHELAHVVRHVLDGGARHFARDALRFVYPRRHSCQMRSNLGFAFNEGWAEYWAGSCINRTVPPLDDYRVEGNVATALRELQSRCGTTDAQMVEVLARSRGRVHSFPEFRTRHQELYGCE
ncbi:hypothetical protein BU14_2262s0001 [Porphyra umbilicalis]|uniref:Uncharacterized protein n=1 Tax=Porphyra umbilicalis TaxID=2786 RepID=A0A1X6NJI8_PORUM|nr:hypothetical protein BU14_2262s0001 [Porphyra umbilicalis]|eukprot:OSX68777.1 hypothetical protein BU14_2262s0001 [Porphyra umbilicalis]